MVDHIAGFLFDREWMVVKAETGRTVTMSRAPKLALVQPSLPAAAMRGESVPSNATLGTNIRFTTFLESFSACMLSIEVTDSAEA